MLLIRSKVPADLIFYAVGEKGILVIDVFFTFDDQPFVFCQHRSDGVDEAGASALTSNVPSGS